MKKIILNNILLIAVIFLIINHTGIQASDLTSPTPIYQRIISISPAMTEAIYLLKADESLLADTIYCTRPAAAQKKEKIGTLRDINIEKILMLKPDLVLTTQITDPQQIETIKNFGIKVAVFPEPKNFNEISHHFLELGILIGKSAEADQIIRAAETEINRIKQLTLATKPVKVFIQIGAKPLYTVTRNSFINDLIQLCGGENIAAQSNAGLYSREQVIKANPEIIIITAMGGQKDKEEIKVWQKLKELTAVKNKQIFIVDPDLICRPLIPNFLEAAITVTDLIHPELQIKKLK